MTSLMRIDLFKIVKCMIYISLTVLGYYFITEGEVLQRYRDRKTNFAEYSEPISELPAIVTWIEDSEHRQTDLKLHKHYKLIYCAPYWNCEDENSTWATELQEGYNIVGPSFHLEPSFRNVKKMKFKKDAGSFENVLRLEKMGTPEAPYSKIRIMHLNNTKQELPGFVLMYKFKDKANYSDVVAGITLTSNNNSRCGYGSSFHDGDFRDIFAKTAEEKVLSVNPEKFLNDPDLEACRGKPHNEALLNVTKRLMNNNCNETCKPNGYWTCTNNQGVLSIPECHGDQKAALVECFNEQEKRANGLVMKKSCTTLQYSNIVIRNSIKTRNKMIRFRVDFPNPPKVIVKEEYLIFDMVSMIGAVGGTLGLCIGFSFMEFACLIIKLLKIIVGKILKKTANGNMGKLYPEQSGSVSKCGTQISSQTKFRGQKSIDEDVLIKMMINQEALMARVLDLENKHV